MKPLIHAKSSAAKHGGKPEDYLPIHDFMDSTKSALPDVRHRAVLHSSFGIFIVERVFGTFITNSDGREISVRDIAEDHVIEDLGFIPTLEKWFEGMEIQEWMIRPALREKKKEDTLEMYKKILEKMEKEPPPVMVPPAPPNPYDKKIWPTVPCPWTPMAPWTDKITIKD